MSKVLAIFFLLSIVAPRLNAQEYLIEGKSATIVYEVPDRSKSDLHQAALHWFDNEDSTSKYVIESNDADAGTIRISEVNQVYYKNIGKLMYPNRSGMAEMLSGDFSYDIELAFEDGTYMVRYQLTGMEKEMYGRDDLFYACIDFEEIDEKALAEYNESMNKLLVMNAVFKKRRNIFKDG